MLYSFFPRYKVSYDPQEANDTEIEQIYANSSVFDKTWIDDSQPDEDAWRMAFGAYSSDDNDTYYDAKHYVIFTLIFFIYSKGPLMIYENETLITIEGINAFTDLDKAAEEEEQFVYATTIQTALSLLLLLVPPYFALWFLLFFSN